MFLRSFWRRQVWSGAVLFQGNQSLNPQVLNTSSSCLWRKNIYIYLASCLSTLCVQLQAFFFWTFACSSKVENRRLSSPWIRGLLFCCSELDDAVLLYVIISSFLHWRQFRRCSVIILFFLLSSVSWSVDQKRLPLQCDFVALVILSIRMH